MEVYKAICNQQGTVIIRANNYGDAMSVLLRDYPLISIMEWTITRVFNETSSDENKKDVKG